MYLLFYAFIFWVPLFSGSWIPASQLKIRTDSVVPESLYLNSIIIGSLYPFFKIRTKMAVHGSLYPFLKIRAKMAVHGCLFQNSDQFRGPWIPESLFKIRTNLAVHGSLYPFLKIRTKMAVHGSLFQNSDQFGGPWIPVFLF